jgi:hypothetical protein
MAREKSSILDSGDMFPEITFQTITGKEVVLPKDFGNGWSLFLVYRGHW